MDQLTQRSDDSSPPAEQGGTNTLQETPAATLQEALAVIANLQAQLTQAQTPEPVRQAPQQAPPTPAPSGSSEPENPGQIAAAITAALQGLQIPKTHAKTSSFQFPKDIPRFHNDSKLDTVTTTRFFQTAEDELKEAEVDKSRWVKLITNKLLRGPAQTWFDGLENIDPNTMDYDDFKRQALRAFSSAHDGKILLDKFRKHRLTQGRRPTKAYLDEFKTIKSQIQAHNDPKVSKYFTSQQYIDHLMEGLNSDTQTQLATHVYEGAAGLEQLYVDAQSTGDSIWRRTRDIQQNYQNRNPRRPPGDPVRVVPDPTLNSIMVSLQTLLQQQNGTFAPPPTGVPVAALHQAGQQTQKPTGSNSVPEKYRNLPQMTPDLKAKCVAENRCFRCREVLGTPQHPGRTSRECNIFTSSARRFNNLESEQPQDSESDSGSLND
mmetsp:Transcript_29043/g.45545  ORF Transcript_29043/g.45545 Transcript_29043/m.45545 type:complete len:434 (-) Transcript_29043:104-1405(-)|eukprot:CAMPEP_0184309566 /NCGR_PEP_ID=MMETSP1049-20130417/17687_1 /TAXON_ID=77928 /ORGANISM="Proteomonas sulcata, Strain CCMP704" /LENGTH=433 /DNA_ID=CAMNT_0026622459 /DNA_START=43 /DNA_END=1344 /DNA_ORIENTATION=+